MAYPEPQSLVGWHDVCAHAWQHSIHQIYIYGFFEFELARNGLLKMFAGRQASAKHI